MSKMYGLDINGQKLVGCRVSDVQITGVFGHYNVYGEFFDGGQAILKKCEKSNGEQVVIKLFHLKPYWNSINHAKLSQLKSYLAEATAYETFTYRGIDKVPILFDFGKTLTGSIPFLVMEKLGPTLASWMNVSTFKRFTNRSALKLSYQLVSCIEAIHSAGIVHRDIKPENFCFARHSLNGQLVLKIIDFGCSKVYDPASIDPLPSKLIYDVTGTYSYCSRASHLTSNILPYDDLESVFYIIVRLFAEQLGWAKTCFMPDRSLFNAKTTFWEKGWLESKPLYAIFMHIQGLEREKEIHYGQLKDVIIEQLNKLDKLNSLRDPKDEDSFVAICLKENYVRQTITEHLSKHEPF